jgi:hypothetical protein
MRKEGRAPLDEQPTLLARILIAELKQIAKSHNLQGRVRVAYKRNTEGHHVVALIFEPQPP